MVAARAAVIRVDDLRVEDARALAAVLVEGPRELGELDQALVVRHPQFPTQPLPGLGTRRRRVLLPLPSSLLAKRAKPLPSPPSCMRRSASCTSHASKSRCK